MRETHFRRFLWKRIPTPSPAHRKLRVLVMRSMAKEGLTPEASGFPLEDRNSHSEWPRLGTITLCPYVCLYIDMCVYVCVCLSVSMCVCVCDSLCLSLCVCVCVCLYLCMCILCVSLSLSVLHVCVSVSRTNSVRGLGPRKDTDKSLLSVATRRSPSRSAQHLTERKTHSTQLKILEGSHSPRGGSSSPNFNRTNSLVSSVSLSSSYTWQLFGLLSILYFTRFFSLTRMLL